MHTRKDALTFSCNDVLFLPLLLQSQRLHGSKDLPNKCCIREFNITTTIKSNRTEPNQTSLDSFWNQQCTWRWMTSSRSSLGDPHWPSASPPQHLDHPLTSDVHRHPYNSQYTRSILPFFCTYTNMQTSQFYSKISSSLLFLQQQQVTSFIHQ